MASVSDRGILAASKSSNAVNKIESKHQNNHQAKRVHLNSQTSEDDENVGSSLKEDKGSMDIYKQRHQKKLVK